MKKNSENKKTNCVVYTREIKGRKYLYCDVTLNDGRVVEGVAVNLPFDKKFKLTSLIIHGVNNEK